MARFIRLSTFVLTLTLFGIPNTSQAADSEGGTSSQASLSACGNIHVEANAQCEVIPPSVDCEVECSDFSFEAACDAKLAVECEGECNLSAKAECNAQCQGGCEAECEADPGRFDCAAECNAECYANCGGQCEADEDSASCHGHCEASCDASCDAECDIDLPSVDCEASCNASCEGSCKAEANFDCQISCQREAYANCEVELEGGCKGACEAEEGRLICDGEYVDYGNNLDKCVAALKAALDIQVKTYAEGSATCGGGHCEAEGEAGVSCECSTAPGQTKRLPVWAMFSLALGLAFAVRRRVYR